MFGHNALFFTLFVEVSVNLIFILFSIFIMFSQNEDIFSCFTVDFDCQSFYWRWDSVGRGILINAWSLPFSVVYVNTESTVHIEIHVLKSKSIANPCLFCGRNTLCAKINLSYLHKILLLHLKTSKIKFIQHNKMRLFLHFLWKVFSFCWDILIILFLKELSYHVW